MAGRSPTAARSVVSSRRRWSRASPTTRYAASDSATDTRNSPPTTSRLPVFPAAQSSGAAAAAWTRQSRQVGEHDRGEPLADADRELAGEQHEQERERERIRNHRADDDALDPERRDERDRQSEVHDKHAGSVHENPAQLAEPGEYRDAHDMWDHDREIDEEQPWWPPWRRR